MTEEQVSKLRKAYAELCDASNGIVGRAMASGPSAFAAVERYTTAEFDLGIVIDDIEDEG